MAKDKETPEKKPISLIEARNRMKEHAVTSRIHGNRQGQAVASAEQRKPEDRKGGR